MHHLLIANDASSNYPVFGYFRLLKNTTIGVLLSLKEIHWTIELLSFKGICCTEVIINFLPSTNFSSSPFFFFDHFLHLLLTWEWKMIKWTFGRKWKILLFANDQFFLCFTFLSSCFHVYISSTIFNFN